MKKQEKYKTLLREMLAEWHWVMHYVRRYRGIVLLYILLGLTGTAMSLGTAVASKYLIDAVVSHWDTKLAEYAVLTVSLALFQFVFQALASWISAIVGTRANNEMREEIYSKVVRAGWEDINAFHSGDLLNRIEGDVAAVSNGVISFIPGVFTKLLQFFGALVIVLWYDKTMALLSLLSAPFLFASSRILVRTMRRYSKSTRDLNGKVLAFSEESIRNIQIVKAFDLTRQYIDNFRDTLSAYRKVKLSYEKFSVIMTFVLSVTGLAVSMLCYGWGVYRLWQGVITFGTMTLFLQLAGGLSASFSSLAGLVPSAISIATSAGRIMEVTAYGQEDDSKREEALSLMRSTSESGVSVCADNVTFTYRDAESPVLKNVSFRVDPGETVALTGPSGEGKTTILRLLLGLVTPQDGRIYLEGEGGSLDISDSTRRFCAYVPQETGLFSGTIAENLRMIDPSADDGRLYGVLEQAELGEFVSSLPDGLNTVLGEMGENLSAGQAQRVAIARALLKDAPVLLLDEATSALDPATEKAVLQNILRENPLRTCIVTTHRESVLPYCDRVYKVDNEGTLCLDEKYSNMA